jgi:hypothetical protein
MSVPGLFGNAKQPFWHTPWTCVPTLRIADFTNTYSDLIGLVPVVPYRS